MSAEQIGSRALSLAAPAAESDPDEGYRTLGKTAQCAAAQPPQAQSAPIPAGNRLNLIGTCLVALFLIMSVVGFLDERGLQLTPSDPYAQDITASKLDCPVVESSVRHRRAWAAMSSAGSSSAPGRHSRSRLWC